MAALLFESDAAETDALLDSYGVYEASGEAALEDVSHLAIRSQQLTGLHPEAAAGLINLRALSLSHNAVEDAASFVALASV